MIEVPSSVLTSEVLSTKARVLLAMLSTCDDSLTTHHEAWSIAQILGFVDGSGEPTRQGLKAVRQARQALNKEGVLLARQVPRMVQSWDWNYETQEQIPCDHRDGEKWVWTVNLSK
jgi:hypothetical protein